MGTISIVTAKGENRSTDIPQCVYHSLFNVSTKVSHTSFIITMSKTTVLYPKTSVCPRDPHLSKSITTHLSPPNENLGPGFDICSTITSCQFYFLKDSRAIHCSPVQALTMSCTHLCHSRERGLLDGYGLCILRALCRGQLTAESPSGAPQYSQD